MKPFDIALRPLAELLNL